MVSGNTNAIFNNGGTISTETLNTAHAANINEDTTDDIVFVNNKGAYVLSGNTNATYNLNGGIFKNANSGNTYAYKLSTPTNVSDANAKVNMNFNGNITFATGSGIRSIYVTNANTETFKIGAANANMKLAFYVQNRGTKVITDIDSATGFTNAFTYKNVIYVEEPNRDSETSSIPWGLYKQKVNNINNVYVGYETFEVIIDANGGKFVGMTGDTNRIVRPGAVNPTTYSILIPNGYKFNYLTTPSRLGYNALQFSTKPRATDSGAVRVTNDTTYNNAIHGTHIYLNWKPITYTIKFDPATTSVTETMNDVRVDYDQKIKLPKNLFTTRKASFSFWEDKEGIDYSKPDPVAASRISKTYEDQEEVSNLRCVDNDVVTLYANWETAPYVIIFDKSTPSSPGGFENKVNGVMSNQKMSGSPQNLNANKYSVDGYRFIGWSRTRLTPQDAEAIENDTNRYFADGAKVAIDPEGQPTVTLYAMWGRKKFKVTLAQNETKANIPDPYAGEYEVLYDQRLSDVAAFAAKTRNGYTFANKFLTKQISNPYEKEQFAGTLNNDYYTVDTINRKTENYTLYPLWLNGKATITLNIGDGKMPDGYTNLSFTGYYDAPYNVKGASGEAKDSNGNIITPIASPSSKIFDSWSTDAAGTNKITADTIFANGSSTSLYANYRDRIVYTITFSPGEGYGSMTNQNITEGIPTAIKYNEFYRSGYRFDSWRDINNNKTYYDSQVITVTGNVRLEAQWARSGGGSGNSGGSGGSRGGGSRGSTIPANINNNNNTPQPTEVSWFADPTTGVLVAVDANGNTLSGWKYTNASDGSGTAWHFFNEDGTAKTGWYSENGSTYYLDNTGGMVTGVAYIDGILRNFDDQGALKEQSTAKINTEISNAGIWNYNPISNKWQYMVPNEYGAVEPARNSWFESTVAGMSGWYVVDANGDMLTGFVKNNGFIYYLQEIGLNVGQLVANMVMNINGVLYTINSEGKIEGDTTLLLNSVALYDLDQPILEDTNMALMQNDQMTANVAAANTTQMTGWVDEGNGKTRFMVEKKDETGKTILVPAVGVTQIDGLYYVFDDNGDMLTGLQNINGVLYYLTEQGLARGSIYVGYITVAGVVYFCDPLNGGVATRIN